MKLLLQREASAIRDWLCKQMHTGDVPATPPQQLDFQGCSVGPRSEEPTSASRLRSRIVSEAFAAVFR